MTIYINTHLIHATPMTLSNYEGTPETTTEVPKAGFLIENICNVSNGNLEFTGESIWISRDELDDSYTSLSYLPFTHAMHLMLDHQYLIARKHWDEQAYVAKEPIDPALTESIDNTDIVKVEEGETFFYQPTQEDMAANDWFVLTN